MSRWLVTRPAEDAAALAAVIADRGHEAVMAPLIGIVPLDGPPPALQGVQAILLTSANGARALARRTDRRDLPVLAVGDATARAARQAGFPSVESAGGDAGDLARLAAARLDPAGGALYHAAGQRVAGDLKGALDSAGFSVRREVLYRAEPVSQLPQAAVRALADPKLAGVLFFSPRTAAVFGTLVRAADLTETLARLYALCLSDAVAGRLDPPAWAGIRVAGRPETGALLALLDGPPAAEERTDRPAAWEEGGNVRPNAASVANDRASKDRPDRPIQDNKHARDGMDPRPDSPEETDPPQQADPRQENPAEQIITLFGGIRPTANKLHVPVTTVQGWKKRGAIPEARHGDILAAAEKHGVTIDPALLAASRPPEEAEEAARAEAERGAEEPQPVAGEAPELTPEQADQAARADREAAAQPASGEPGRPEGADLPGDQTAAGEPADLARSAAARPWAEGGERPEAAAESAEDRRREDELAEAEADFEDERRSGREGRDAGRPPPPASHGGGGRGLAWLAALVALIAAGAAVTAPLWGPQYLPDVWPGPVPEQWSERIAGEIEPVAGGQQDTADRVAALSDRVEALDALIADATGLDDAGSLLTRVEELEQRVAQLPENAVGEDRLAEVITEAEGRLADAPAELVAERLAPIAERLAQLEGLPQQVRDLESQLQTAEIDATLLGEVSTRLETLSTALGDAETRLQELAQIAEARREADMAAQAMSLAVGQLRRDLVAGEPFAAALATVRSLVADRPSLVGQIERIEPYADTGIPTRNELAARFPEAMARIRAAERATQGEGAVDRALGALEGLVTVRRAPGEVEGGSTADVLARAEHRVGNGNIAGAVTALEELQGEAAEAASGWLAPASARLAAEEVLAALDAAALERLAGEGGGEAGEEAAGQGAAGQGGEAPLQPPEGGPAEDIEAPAGAAEPSDGGGDAPAGQG